MMMHPHLPGWTDSQGRAYNRRDPLRLMDDLECSKRSLQDRQSERKPYVSSSKLVSTSKVEAGKTAKCVSDYRAFLFGKKESERNHFVAQELVMSLLVLTDRGCKRSAVMCRCSVFNRSWQTVDSRNFETRSYAFIRSKTAMNLWLFKMVFPTSTIACSVPLYFVKLCCYLWNTTYLSTSRLMVADIVFLA